jgi:hypothetical protein
VQTDRDRPTASSSRFPGIQDPLSAPAKTGARARSRARVLDHRYSKTRRLRARNCQRFDQVIKQRRPRLPRSLAPADHGGKGADGPRSPRDFRDPAQVREYESERPDSSKLRCVERGQGREMDSAASRPTRSSSRPRRCVPPACSSRGVCNTQDQHEDDRQTYTQTIGSTL